MNWMLHKIRRHKLRYISVVIALVIVQSLLCFVFGMKEDLRNQFYKNFLFDLNDLYEVKVYQYHSNCYPEMVELDFKSEHRTIISQLPEVVSVCHASFSAICSTDNEGYPQKLYNGMYGFGIKAGVDFQNVFDLPLLRGNYFSEQEGSIPEVILTKKLADDYRIMNRELPVLITLPIDWVDRDSMTYQVCGVVDDLPIKDYRHGALCPWIICDRYKHALTVRLAPNTDIKELQKKIRSRFVGIGNGNDVVVTLTSVKDQFLFSFKKTNRRVVALLSIVPMILLYTFFAMLGLFYIESKRNRSAYGIMRALGITKTRLFEKQFTEAFMLLALALFLQVLLGSLMNIQMFFDYDQGGYFMGWLQSAFILLFIVCCAVLIPTLTIIKTKPVDALAEE